MANWAQQQQHWQALTDQLVQQTGKDPKDLTLARSKGGGIPMVQWLCNRHKVCSFITNSPKETDPDQTTWQQKLTHHMMYYDCCSEC
jgi:hypothetical protein